MKVYNLACPLDHRFEGWFASEEDCLAQQAKGMLACPICDSTEITRMPSAPRIGRSLSSKDESTSLALTTPNADLSSMGSAHGEVVAQIGRAHV